MRRGESSAWGEGRQTEQKMAWRPAKVGQPGDLSHWEEAGDFHCRRKTSWQSGGVSTSVDFHRGLYISFLNASKTEWPKGRLHGDSPMHYKMSEVLLVQSRKSKPSPLGCSENNQISQHNGNSSCSPSLDPHAILQCNSPHAPNSRRELPCHTFHILQAKGALVPPCASWDMPCL